MRFHSLIFSLISLSETCKILHEQNYFRLKPECKALIMKASPDLFICKKDLVNFEYEYITEILLKYISTLLRKRYKPNSCNYILTLDYFSVRK